tara:strand:- start:39 stop:365 length:327 start_codon:yes stop_codon:yes gene_type:complete
MKYIMLAIIIICTSSIVIAENAFIKSCMLDYRYKNFDTYNYAKAAACVQKYRTNEQETKVVEMREFLKKKPWFRGPDWKWEQTADWRCARQLSSGRTICRKPYFTRAE